MRFSRTGILIYDSPQEANDALAALIDDDDSDSGSDQVPSLINDNDTEWGLDSSFNYSDHGSDTQPYEPSTGVAASQTDAFSTFQSDSDSDSDPGSDVTPTPSPLSVKKKHDQAAQQSKPPTRPRTFFDLDGKVRNRIFDIFLKNTSNSYNQLHPKIWFCSHTSSELVPHWILGADSPDILPLLHASKQTRLELTSLLLPMAKCRVHLCHLQEHRHALPLRLEHQQAIRKVIVSATVWKPAHDQICGTVRGGHYLRVLQTLCYLELDLFGFEADPVVLFGPGWERQVNKIGVPDVAALEAVFMHQLGRRCKLVRKDGDMEEYGVASDNMSVYNAGRAAIRAKLLLLHGLVLPA